MRYRYGSIEEIEVMRYRYGSIEEIEVTVPRSFQVSPLLFSRSFSLVSRSRVRVCLLSCSFSRSRSHQPSSSS